MGTTQSNHNTINDDVIEKQRYYYYNKKCANCQGTQLHPLIFAQGCEHIEITQNEDKEKDEYISMIGTIDRYHYLIHSILYDSKKSGNPVITSICTLDKNKMKTMKIINIALSKKKHNNFNDVYIGSFQLYEKNEHDVDLYIETCDYKENTIYIMYDYCDACNGHGAHSLILTQVTQQKNNHHYSSKRMAGITLLNTKIDKPIYLCKVNALYDTSLKAHNMLVNHYDKNGYSVEFGSFTFYEKCN